MFETIPDELLYIIVKHLDYKSLIRFSRCSKKAHKAASIDKLWRKFCVNIWLVNELSNEDVNFKQCFCRMYKSFGQYVQCYARLKSIWSKIFRITRDRVPLVHQSLKPGLSERQLDEVEKLIKHKLPDCFRCSYRICDGQESIPYGLFGGYEGDDPGDLMASMSTDIPSLIGGYQNFFNETSKPKDWYLLTFAGRKHQMDSFAFGPNFFFALFLKDSEEDASATVPDGAASAVPHGAVVTARKETNQTETCELFVHANTFVDFLQNYADNVESYPVHQNRLLKYTLNSCGDTGPFRVVTRTVFFRERSCCREYNFRYYITMSMDAEGRQGDSCQLMTRHWVITDDQGNVERVDGPGVVGQFPIMKPGASHFWISGTSFKTVTGEMGGHFTMVNLGTGVHMQIDCPVYKMAAPLVVHIPLE